MVLGDSFCPGTPVNKHCKLETKPRIPDTKLRPFVSALSEEDTISFSAFLV
jgi:hypothetical protein